MVAAYTTRIRLTKQGEGDNDSTWGTVLNDEVIDLTDFAIAGYTAVNLASGDATLTSNDGAPDESRSAMLELTGTLTGNRDVYIPAVSKSYIVRNNTSGAYSATVLVTGGTGYAIPQGEANLIYCDAVSVREVSSPTQTQFTSISTTNITGVNVSVTGNISAAVVSATTITGDTVSATTIAGGTVLASSIIVTSTSPEIHLNDTDGVLGAAVNSRILFQASGATQGSTGFGTASGTMGITNSQGSLVLQADTNNAHTDSYISLTVDNSAKMRITSGGDVGIGTITPSYKLDVVGDIYSSGDVISASDIRYKENLKTITNAVDKINKLNGYTFTRTDNNDKNKRYAGVIAQEVQEVLPEVVSTNNEGYLTVSYGNMVSLLIEAIKELDQKITSKNCKCEK